MFLHGAYNHPKDQVEGGLGSGSSTAEVGEVHREDCEKRKAWHVLSLKGQGLLPSCQRWHEKTTKSRMKKKQLKMSANSYSFYWVPTTILKSSDVTSFRSHGTPMSCGLYQPPFTLKRQVTEWLVELEFEPRSPLYTVQEPKGCVIMSLKKKKKLCKTNKIQGDRDPT